MEANQTFFLYKVDLLTSIFQPILLPECRCTWLYIENCI